MRAFLRSVLKGAAMICGSVSFFYGVFPLVHRVFNVGAAALTGFGVLSICTAGLWNRFDGWGKIPRRLHDVNDKHRPTAPAWWRHLRLFLVICLSLFAVTGAILSVLMAAAAQRTPKMNATVIVLGCKVEGDRPSLMLQRRLDAALDYLQTNPAAKVVCSGGKDAESPYSEAMVMQQYLIENGIPLARIYREEQSTSTEENVGFSARLIAQEGLADTVAIATDTFHQFRAQFYAKESGLTPAALPTNTPWGIVPAYWVREWFALGKAWVLGQRF